MNEVYIKKEDVAEWIGKYFSGDFASIDDLIGIIEDLDSEVDNLKDELEKSEEYIRVNCTTSPYMEYGVRESDFH